MDDCRTDTGCITCGDVALPLQVVSIEGDTALCRDRDGREEQVALELVKDAWPEDWLLVHAGTALARLTKDAVAQALGARR
jgi:hydrogenase expression/formation protein HypC